MITLVSLAKCALAPLYMITAKVLYNVVSLSPRIFTKRCKYYSVCLASPVYSRRGVSTIYRACPENWSKLRHECLKSKACVSLQLDAGKRTNGEKREEKNVV